MDGTSKAVPPQDLSLELLVTHSLDTSEVVYVPSQTPLPQCYRTTNMCQRRRKSSKVEARENMIGTGF